MLLRQLYTYNSLRNTNTGVKFSVKNRLTDVKFSELKSVKIDGKEIPKENIVLLFEDDSKMAATEVTEDNPIDFPLRKKMDVHCETENLDHGKYKIQISQNHKYHTYKIIHIQITSSSSYSST